MSRDPARHPAAAARALAVVLAATLAAAVLPAQPDEAGCTDHRELDFWLGEWEVQGPDGRPVGVNRIASRQGGCVLEEQWRSAAGGTGMSINYFDPSAGLWRQNWVDSRGGVVRYEGAYRDGAMRFAGEHVRPDGRVVLARSTLAPQPDGTVRHEIEHSSDGGTSWVAYFDGLYVPLGAATAATAEPGGPPAAPAAEPAPAAAPPSVPAPAAEPAPAAVPRDAPAPRRGDIQPLTGTAPGGPVLDDERPQIQMASPMTLEIELGSVHLLPAGQAWYTDEVAAYACNGVTVLKVEAARRERRGQSALELTFHLHSLRQRVRVELLAELLSGGEVIGSERIEKIALGKQVPAHDPKRGLTVDARFGSSDAELAELFRDGRRPSVRITLAVP